MEAPYWKSFLLDQWRCAPMKNRECSMQSNHWPLRELALFLSDGKKQMHLGMHKVASSDSCNLIKLILSTFKLKVSSWFFKLQKSFQYPTNIKIIILWQDFHSRLTIIWSKDKIKKWFVLHFIGKNEEAVKRAYVLNGLKNNKKRILFETSFTCTFQKLPSTFALLVGDTHLFQAF